MASEDIQTNIRIPAELKDRVQASAAESGRSLSSEIAYRVLQSYELGKLLEKRTTEAKTSSAISSRLIREGLAKDQEVEALRAELNALKATSDLIKSQREADIEAATGFLQKQLTVMAERAAASERELNSQAALLNIMRQFVVSMAGLFHTTHEPTAQLVEMMRKTALASQHGDIEETSELAGQMIAFLQAVMEQARAVGGAGKPIERVQSVDLPPGTTVRGKLVTTGKPTKKAKAPKASASVNKVILVGNLGTERESHLDKVIIKREPPKPGQRDMALGDIVPPGQDVGSQHRPARAPRPPKKVASKRK